MRTLLDSLHRLQDIIRQEAQQDADCRYLLGRIRKQANYCVMLAEQLEREKG